MIEPYILGLLTGLLMAGVLEMERKWGRPPPGKRAREVKVGNPDQEGGPESRRELVRELEDVRARLRLYKDAHEKHCESCWRERQVGRR